MIKFKKKIQKEATPYPRNPGGCAKVSSQVSFRTLNMIGNKISILMITKIIVSVFTFLGGVLLSRSLTKLDYATYSHAMLIGSTLAIFTVGFQQSLYYFIPREKVTQSIYTIVRMFCSAVFLVVIILACLYIYRESIYYLLNNPKISIVLLGALSYSLFFSLSGFTESILINTNHVKKILFISTFTSLIIIVAIGTCLFFAFPIQYIISLIALAYAVNVFYNIYCFRNNFMGFELKLLVDFKKFSKELKYSFSIVIASLLGMIGRKIDLYMVSSMFDPEQFAIYTRGAFEIPFISIITYSTFSILIPEFTKLLENEDYKKILVLHNDAARRIAMFFFPMAIFLIVSAQSLMEFLFTSKYIESTLIFQIYTGLLFLNFIVYGAIPRASGKTDIIYKMALLMAISNLILNYPFIIQFGPYGAAIATILSNYITMGYALYKNSRILKCNILEILPWKHLFLILLSSILPGIALIYFNKIVSSNAYSIFIGFILYMPIVLLFYKFFHMFSSSDIDFFTSYLKKNRFFKK